jgi:hypothetical protein
LQYSNQIILFNIVLSKKLPLIVLHDTQCIPTPVKKFQIFLNDKIVFQFDHVGANGTSSKKENALTNHNKYL